MTKHKTKSTSGFTCPECGVWTVVNSTRTSPFFGLVRRRECANGHKFTTSETLIPQEVMTETMRASRLRALQAGREKYKVTRCAP